MNPHTLSTHFHNSFLARAVRNGLTLAIPFLIMGSFSLLFRNFPNDRYQFFLETWQNGGAATLLDTVYTVTLGSLAMVLCITISLSYGLLAEPDRFILYPIISICSYLAFCGGIQSQDDYIFSAEWVFTAMCITLLSCVLFRKILELGSRLERLHTTGAEYLFNLSIQSLVPAILIILVFTVVGYLLRSAWGSSNITNFGSYIFLQIFRGISGNIFGILLYVIITRTLWFFGIHGTNTLEAVSQTLFEDKIAINQTLLTAGMAPTEIFSKTFLDTFVFLGGCGCALSFVLALCIASRKSHHRKIAHVALPSVLFNISEIAVFGFPIIFNFTMAVPFLLTPVVLTLTSTLATWFGLVPVVTQSVEWTIPLFLSGYEATGSIAGSILQLFNVALGVLIYIPFIRRSEKRETQDFQQAVRRMSEDMAAGEKSGSIPLFLSHDYSDNYYAKTLAMDLSNALRRSQIDLFYQPQLTAQEKVHGVEALLRWKHPVAGYIAPPVIIGLAYESGILNELSYYLLNRACKDALEIQKYTEKEIFLSYNISSKQMEEEKFFEKVNEIIQSYHLKTVHLVLEVTERAAMRVSETLSQDVKILQNYGIQFSLDDFGMGHNSILYLQEGIFSEVKLDGQLVSQIQTNERSKEIISSIIHMAGGLGLRIVAEFVETKEQRDLLLALGCDLYQGYYYSKPIELSGLKEYIAEGTRQ